MFVKICGLREPEHVLAAVEAGADAVGFVMTASPRQVRPETAAALAALVPAHVLTVGVFMGESPPQVRRAVEVSGVRAVQLHGAHPREDFAALRDLGVTLVRAVPSGAELGAGAYDADLLLVDAARPGLGQPWDWAATRGRVSGRWILAGGLTPSNVARAVAEADPWGVDVSSGVERERGVKESALIAGFVAAARA